MKHNPEFERKVSSKAKMNDKKAMMIQTHKYMINLMGYVRILGKRVNVMMVRRAPTMDAQRRTSTMIPKTSLYWFAVDSPPDGARTQKKINQR